MDARDIFEKYVSKLNHKDRQELLDLMTGKLPTETGPVAKRSLLELEGLGADLWSSIDAQQYVDDLRKEWDRRL
jgi:hypothetical protein